MHYTYVYTVQLNLNFTHTCRYTRVLACLTHAKLQKLACACTVAHNFGMRTRYSKHTRHLRDAHHELALCLPHYKCGVTTGTVTVCNEIQLLCHCLASLLLSTLVLNSRDQYEKKWQPNFTHLKTRLKIITI